MKLSKEQKRTITAVVNVFETGSVTGDYGAVSVFPDAPGGQRQVTYGRSQTTEQSGLKDLLLMYSEAFGAYSHELQRYIPQIQKWTLYTDLEFRRILKAAGTDPIMQGCQDRMFDERYFKPAMKWADDNLFFLPLSALVIYDSFIHSGSVPTWLRNKFYEPVPANGGDEKSWVSAYVKTRGEWLKTAANPALHSTTYRTDTLSSLIRDGNWTLTLPITAHGVKILL